MASLRHNVRLSHERRQRRQRCATAARSEGVTSCSSVDDAILNGAGASSGRHSHLNPAPADGTFVQAGVSKEVYVIAGGAPLYVSNWSTPLLGSSGAKYRVSAGKPLAYAGTDRFPDSAKVDQYAIDHAGGAGRLVHLLAP